MQESSCLHCICIRARSRHIYGFCDSEIICICSCVAFNGGSKKTTQPFATFILIPAFFFFLTFLCYALYQTEGKMERLESLCADMCSLQHSVKPSKNGY